MLILAREERSFWTPVRVVGLLRTLVVVLVGASLALAVFGDERSAAIRKGDFPVFYSGAYAVAHGESSQLYDQEFHRAVQNRAWPTLRGEIHPYVYPPYVAALLSPLGLLGPVPAHFLFVGVMLISFIAATLLLRNEIEPFRLYPFDSIAALLLFAPLTFGVLGGQSSALSLLCFAGLIHFGRSREPRNELLAGLCLGCWFFKPHLPLLALFFLLCARRWRIALGAIPPAAVYYLTAAAVSGFDWPLHWIAAVQNYLPTEFLRNSYQLVSLDGFFFALGQLFAAGGLRSAIQVVGLISVIVLACSVARAFVRSGNSNAALERLLYLLAPTIVLVSPHTHFYDLALCCFPLARYLTFSNDRSISLLLFAYMATYYVVSHRPLFPLSPLVLIPLATLVIIQRRAES